MKNKKMMVALLATLFAATTSAGAMTVASAAEYDGTANLATDASLWTESWWTDHMDYAPIDENGIVFNEYGRDSAVAGVSLSEGLPYGGVISMTFNSEVPTEGTPAGWLKMVFADASGAANGNAMKPWEISDKAEHLALEIQNNAVFLWRYNADNVDGVHQGLPLNAATNNYIDGQDHTVTIEYSTTETAYNLKLSIDGTVQYDNSIATTKLYCNSILTIGGYGNSVCTDDLTISEVKVTKTQENPPPVLDENDLLGKADAWTVAENEGVVLDAAYGTLSINGYAGADAAVLNAELPVEAKISLKTALTVPAGDPVHTPVAKIVLLSNGTEKVFLQFDDDGNMWLRHVDYSTGGEGTQIAFAGDWAPALLQGTNSVNISITPELTDGNEDIYISVSAGSKVIGLAVTNLSLMNGNQLALLGGEVGSVVYSNVKVEDQIKEMADTALAEVDLLADATNWALTGMSIADGKMPIAGPGYATTVKAIPVNSTIEFTFNATDNASAWYYLDIDTAARTGMWDAVAEGAGRFRITASGSQAGFYTVDLNGAGITTVSSALTDLCDGNDQAFKFVTETVAEGVKVTFYRNGTEEFSTVYASDTAVGAAEGFYLSFGATGAHAADPIISNVKATYVAEVDVTAYNAAIATKRAIYALNANPTEAEAADVKAAAQALLDTVAGYTDEQLEVANNALYAEYVIAQADAAIAVAADKAAAKTVADLIAALNYETITAENVEQAKAAVASIKEAYNALTDAQKAYVENYADVETLEIAINDYEASLVPDGGSSDTTSDTTSEPKQNKGGCFGTIGAIPALGMLVALAGVAIANKKKED